MDIITPSQTYDIFDRYAQTLPEFEHTILSPEQEKRFQKEFTTSPWYKDFVKSNKEDPLANPDYDYRGAWLGGKDILDINKTLSEHGHEAHGKSRTAEGKWLKNPRTHGTSWKEFFMNETGINPDEAGLSREEAAIQFESAIRRR
tara:strand:+ start:2094 stop:2528 length:435 start_codon:yes stop_codon:yes gene_type:complete